MFKNSLQMFLRYRKTRVQLELTSSWNCIYFFKCTIYEYTDMFKPMSSLPVICALQASNYRVATGVTQMLLEQTHKLRLSLKTPPLMQLNLLFKVKM